MKKTVRRSKKYHAHDEANSAKVGDVVRIEETAPISKNKRWTLVQRRLDEGLVRREAWPV